MDLRTAEPNPGDEPLRQAESIVHLRVDPVIDTPEYEDRKCDAKALDGMARPMATSDAAAAMMNFFTVKPLYIKPLGVLTLKH
jgi:hypothetical protein